MVEPGEARLEALPVEMSEARLRALAEVDSPVEVRLRGLLDEVEARLRALPGAAEHARLSQEPKEARPARSATARRRALRAAASWRRG
eukprot:13680288-Alexandrium_andersonii.AAC.1